MVTRNRIRVGAIAAAFLTVAVLKAADWFSMRPPEVKRGIRLVSANANVQPLAVVDALQKLSPDIVALQETGVSCEAAARILGYGFLDGSDQCILAERAMVPMNVDWPGPWRPPQLVAMDADRTLVVANVRLAMPEVLAALATFGNQWYSEEQRRAQFSAMRRLLSAESPAVVCGDFNAFPSEVDLGDTFADVWRKARLGASFPAWLPIVRIDQCWVSPQLIVHDAWTVSIPSDHRALVVDFEIGGAARPRGSKHLEPPS